MLFSEPQQLTPPSLCACVYFLGLSSQVCFLSLIWIRRGEGGEKEERKGNDKARSLRSETIHSSQYVFVVLLSRRCQIARSMNTKKIDPLKHAYRYLREREVNIPRRYVWMYCYSAAWMNEWIRGEGESYRRNKGREISKGKKEGKKGRQKQRRYNFLCSDPQLTTSTRTQTKHWWGDGKAEEKEGSVVHWFWYWFCWESASIQLEYSKETWGMY